MDSARLGATVEKYYIDNIEQLTSPEQFHFLSRLYLWKGSPLAKRRLSKLFKEWATLDDSVQKKLQAVASETPGYTTGSSKSPINSLELRQPFLDKYPTLRPQGNTLSRIHFLHTIYGVDTVEEFPKLFPKEEADSLFDSLLQDKQATTMLATYAINFLYFYNSHKPQVDDLGAILLDFPESLAGSTDKHEIQVYIYFYTHCIIGASGFYSRPIIDKAPYLKMLSRMERTIDSNFSSIHLDNKFEYLICCRLLNVSSKLEEKIYSEASRSISTKGTYMVDTENTNPQLQRTELGNSEHRNVLFLMSLSDPLYCSPIASVNDTL